MLPATGAGIYLDTATAGPLPEETARALAESDEWELRVGRGGLDRAADLAQREVEAQAVIGALLGVDVDEITMTAGVADGIARARSVAGDRPVTVIQAVDPMTGALLQAPPARPTPAASSARRTDPFVVLDAGMAAGAIELPTDRFGAHAIVLPGHRWLLGPEGVGALWISRELRERGPGADRAGFDVPARRSLLGMARSVGWLEMYVGLEPIYGRVRRASSWLWDALGALETVTVLTPAEKAAIVTFRIGGWDASEAVEELSHRVSAIVSVVEVEGGMPAIRASVGVWNTRPELERFVEVVGLLARHSPQSIPRRPSLIVLGTAGGA